MTASPALLLVLPVPAPDLVSWSLVVVYKLEERHVAWSIAEGRVWPTG